MERVIIEALGSVPKSRERHDGDLSDRLCFPYTSILFSLFAIIVSTKQFVGEPIQCWVPAHFTGDQSDYANDYCWLGNTYYLPLESSIQREGQEHDGSSSKAQVNYYHWIPIVLLVQALFFYFPKSIWRMFCQHSGLDVEDLVNASQTFIHLELEETREKMLNFMMKQLDRYLSIVTRKAPKTETKMEWIRWRFNQIRGWYLTFAYFFVKLLSLGNVLAQLFLLDLFLGSGFHFYGFEILDRIVRGKDSDELVPRFPRATMCDFKIRRLGANHRYTVHCVLPINLFNEKIYLCVWLWLVFLIIVQTLSLITWVTRLLLSTSRSQYVEGHLNLNPRESRLLNRIDTDRPRFNRFLRSYLQYDGIFVLRLIGHNTSSITVIELAISLWDNFKQKDFNTT